MTGPAGTCQYDAGSMYDCRPVCDRAAAVEIVHRGYGGWYATRVCREHLGAARGRIWPYEIAETRDLAGRCCETCGRTTVTPPTCADCSSAAGIGALRRFP